MEALADLSFLDYTQQLDICGHVLAVRGCLKPDAWRQNIRQNVLVVNANRFAIKIFAVRMKVWGLWEREPERPITDAVLGSRVRESSHSPER
jgi:hypothetical protein